MFIFLSIYPPPPVQKSFKINGFGGDKLLVQSLFVRFYFFLKNKIRRVALLLLEAALCASSKLNAVALAQCGKPSGLSTQARTQLRFLYIPNEKSTCQNFQQVRLESTRQVER